MILFVFKIHEKCSCRDGMILVIAESREEARQYILKLAHKDVWPVDMCGGDYSCDEPFLDEDDVVSFVKEEHQNTLYHDEWYLAETYNLSDGYEDVDYYKGVRLVSYHDG